ncbi:hypothetical protein [Cumulibacter soli]|uniref:hypothetical protein n=1 Tax=Cumulibacter soli TaxID=2546344 RepID=UPI0010676631|nr:hypothetical protein [Cumulibacter soli]
MTHPAEGQGRIDRLVVSFTTLMLLSMVGMMINSAALIIIPVPLMVALLMLLAVLRPGNRWPVRSVFVTQGIFHLISLALWIVALVAIDSEQITIAGLPTSTGVLVVIAWPFYTVVTGLLYAFCSKHLVAVQHAGDQVADR